MKQNLLYALAAVIVMLMPRLNFAQTPNLGVAQSFSVFTAIGAFENNGTTSIIGDIGTNVGAFSGFPPGVVIGDIHVADAISAQAAIDVAIAYSYLAGLTCSDVIGVTMGNGQVLTPGIYCVGSAATLNGNLTLDAEGDPDAIFIFQINGAYATSTFASVTLINGASPCNVYWQINGEFDLGDFSVFQGTLLVNGAINLLEGSSLIGRALSQDGAIGLHSNVIQISLPAVAAVITANGPTSICIGGSVTLSGNVDGTWNTGALTSSINVTTSGDYFVTNTTACGSATSNHIIVTVNPLPICNITGDLTVCQGQTTQLCATAGMTSYLWSTGATTECITVGTAGIYTVVITDLNGCSNTCEVTVSVNLLPVCNITGGLALCNVGQTTELCAPPGFVSYLWSTGATTECITVGMAGLYAVVVTDLNGCSSACEVTVTANALPACNITGNLSFCQGQSTQLCAPPGFANYLWSTGEITACITVSTPGLYAVVVTDLNGCISMCEVTVSVNPLPVCNITGGLALCNQGQTTELCAPPGFASYLWSTGATTECITVSAAGLYAVVVTDQNGCSSACEVTVSANQLPACNITGSLLLCQGQTTQLCAPPGFASYLWSTGAFTECITVGTAGLYVVVVTDQNGCTSTCEVTVSVDIIPLSITCPADVTIECDESTLPLNTGTATAPDVCGFSPVITFEDIILQGDCPLEYSISRTWTATDGAGNIIRCTQTITVEDNTPPVITCPAGVTLSCTASTSPALTGMATATDICDVSPLITFVDVTNAGDCPQEYTITRTWTATDACGNSSTCIQILSIEDNAPPTITCPTNTTVQCVSEIPPVNLALVVASDNCGGTATVTHVSDVITGQTCENRFILTRTYRATDVCGNAATCTQVITVFDNTLPSITCPPNLTVQCLSDIPPVNLALVTTSDNCGGTATVTYVGDVISNQVCENQFTVTRTYRATDACGNTATCTQVITVFDNTAPVVNFNGSPFANGDTITVQCYGQDPTWDLPSFDEGSITATDFCGGDVTVAFNQVVENQGNCREDGYINLYRLTWVVTDVCGNSSSVFVFVKLVDTTPPVIFGVPEDITINCLDDMPALPTVVYAVDECLCACIIFSSESAPAPGCLDGQVIVRTWTARDDCGNVAVATQYITLIDEEAPVMIGVPDTACIGDPALSEVYAIDNCGSSFIIQYTDSFTPNPCGGGNAIRRIYTVSDACGNTSRDTSILIPDQTSPQSMVFTNPLLAALEPDEVLVMDCETMSGQFSASDVRLDDPCLSAGGPVIFTERLVETLDCSIGGVAAVIELRWEYTNVCGSVSARTVTVHMMDETSPVFVDFLPEVSIGCNEDLPKINATDNCGEVAVTTIDNIIPGDCEYQYDILRLITATDPCGNYSTRQQMVHVNSLAPVISGVEEGICDDLSIPVVTAQDPCAEEAVAVTMQQDTLTTPCPGGLVVERTWTAVGSCGTVTVMHQRIIMNDETPPELFVPTTSVMYPFLGNNHNLILLSQTNYFLDRLNALNEYSVSVLDDCDLNIIPVFSVDTTYADDCVEDGYFERRTYTWIATDACGNSDTLAISFDIRDDVAPEFSFSLGELPVDVTIVCAPLPPAPIATPVDGAQPITITYTEVIQPGNGTGVFIVTRTWVATDACGNTSTYVQHINWIPDTYLTCEIILPASVECNSHGVIITSVVTGGVGPYTYKWKVVGQKCFIQTGQGTPTLTIYTGWSDVTITLTVTDAFGCVSICTTILSCVESGMNPEDGLSVLTNPEANTELSNQSTVPVLNNQQAAYLKLVNLWPNPAGDRVNISFESSVEDEVQFRFISTMGQVVLIDKISAQKGLNTHVIDVSQVHQGSYQMQMKTALDMQSKVILILRNE